MESAWIPGATAPSDMPSVKLLLTVPEAADALGLCRSVIYELLLCGELRSIKIGRARRIPLTVLEEFVARRLDGAGAETGREGSQA